MDSQGLLDSLGSSGGRLLKSDVTRRKLFERILDQLADNSLFSSGPSPTIFIVYAHNNEKEGTAYDECVRRLITWLERIHARILSDHSPLPPLVSKIEGTDPVGNILANQMCLLPLSCYGAETQRTICVEKVIVCGSEVMESYCRQPSARKYIEEIAQICTNYAEMPQKVTLESTILARVEEECHRDDFHHVLTEIAFLEARKSGLSETSGMVPVVLNQANADEAPMRYLPVFYNTDVKLKLKSPAASSLHGLFFKLLKRLFPDDRDFIQCFRICYDVASLDIGLHNDAVTTWATFDGIVNRQITIAHKAYWRLFCVAVRDGKLRGYTGKLEPQLSQKMQQLENKEQQHRILEWLSPLSVTEIHGRYHDSGTSRMEGTCDWVIRREEFRQWYASETSALLLLRGNMGTGKTYCSSRVIDWVKQGLSTSDNDEAFAYFYCNKQEKARSEPKEILRNIIRQLAIGPWNALATSETVHKTVHELFSKSRWSGISSTFSEWESCLSALIDTYPRTTIILDALDECAELQRRDLISLLAKHAKPDSNAKPVKIFVSSRSEEDIVQHLGEYSVIRMQEAQREGDIATFVRTKIAEHHRWSKMHKDFQNEVIDTLLEKSGDMFLFASLQIQHLLHCNTHPAIRDRLARLPESLEKTYEEIYNHATSNRDERELLDRALRWVMCSARPLSTDELLFAISQDPRSDNVAPPRQDVDEDLIAELCHNLLSLDNNSDNSQPVWRLAHQAVAEYLEGRACCNYDIAHCEAGKVCLTVLSETFGHSPDRPEADSSQSSGVDEGFRRPVPVSEQLSHQSGKHNQLHEPMIEYAVYAWPTHVRAQEHRETHSDHGLSRMLQQFLGEPLKGSRSYERWQEYIFHGDREPQWSIFWPRAKPSIRKFVPISLACYLGLFTPIVNWLKCSSFDINFKHKELDSKWKEASNSQPESMVSWSLVALACLHNETKVLRHLLDQGAVLDSNFEDEVPPIVAAAMRDSVGAAKELIQRGVDLSSPFLGFYGHPLHVAICNNSVEVLRQLLLQSDSFKGKEVRKVVAALGFWDVRADIMTVLLDVGVDVNIPFKNGSLLTIAAERNWKGLVRRLFQSGADGNKEFEKWGYRTNVLESVICNRGAPWMSRLLVEHGVQVTGRAIAAACGWETRVNGNWVGMPQLLLTRAPDLNETWCTSGRRTCALIEVVRQGSVHHVQMLLKHGADVNVSVEGEYGGALSALFLKTLDSRYDKNEAYPTGQMLDVLVEAGADLGILKGDRLDVALAASAFAGLEDRVRLFLERGASPNTIHCHIYRTALGAAAASEHPQAPHIVRTLVNNGADVNVCFLDDVRDRSRNAALALDFPLHFMIEMRWVVLEPKPNRNQHLDTWLQSAFVLVSEGAVWDTNFTQWKESLQKNEPEFSQRNAESLETLGRDIENNGISLLDEMSGAESD